MVNRIEAPTIHIGARLGEIAKTVLMPGDPYRAKYIAERYLDHSVLVNSVRGMLGYSGYYNGVFLTVMGSGMGMPSMGIYSYELFAAYGVDNIIRIGTCGAANERINIRDVILADKAYSVSNFAYVQRGFEGNCIRASESLNTAIENTAVELGIPLVVGAIRSGDVFYLEDIPRERLSYMSEVIGLEMEAYALFNNATALSKNAACILTVTDKRSTGEFLSSEEREKHLDIMFSLALNTASRLNP